MERSAGLVFNMNGRVPDEGGTFKTGLAFAVGKALVIYKRDHRSIFFGRDNAMITGLSPTFSTVGRVGGIPGEMARAIRLIEAQGGNPYRERAMPASIRRVIDLEREVCSCLEESRVPGLDVYS